MSSIPDDFGAKNGTEITNKSTVLEEIDKALNMPKPPAIEYIFVEPFMNWTLSYFSWIGFAGNYYGHAAVRYTLPTGESVVMNIEGSGKGPMVNFVPAEEYIFGTKYFDKGSSQGGIYNRNMVSVRIEDYPEDKIVDLDHYYRKLQKNHDARFSLFFSPVMNNIYRWFPDSVVEHGNCARWTSKGLTESGLIRIPTIFPKRIWVTLFERFGIQNPKNVHVVSYRRVKHAHRTYGVPSDPYISGVAPLHPITNLLYFNLEKFADVVVEVPPTTMTATVSVKKDHYKPSWWRYNTYGLSFGMLGLLITGFFFRRQLAAKASKHLRDRRGRIRPK